MNIKSKNLRAQRDRTVKEPPQPLPPKSGIGDNPPPCPPAAVGGSGGMFDPEFIKDYIEGLRSSLADNAYGGGSDNASELMRRSR